MSATPAPRFSTSGGTSPFAATAAAFYQIIILSQQAGLLSKQADALVGQLAEMKSAAEQTNKLITSNADLAAAAKAQAVALQQSALTAHDSFVMSQRARIASTNVSLEPLQSGQPAKGAAAYSNLGKEPASIDVEVNVRKWTKTEWSGTQATNWVASQTAYCMLKDNLHGSLVAYPTNGLGSGYANSFDSSVNVAPGGEGFVVDDSIVNGDSAIAVTACYIYKTLSELHHTAACYFYLAHKTPSPSNLNICGTGNSFD
jgi:hypothetical protein